MIHRGENKKGRGFPGGRGSGAGVYPPPICLVSPARIDDEVIRMIKMRTVEDHKYFVQEEVGKIIGVSRQMINRRWQVYQNEGLIALLAGEWEKSKITPELLDRLAELVVDNPFLFAHEIKEKLQCEGLCEEISDATLYSALKQMDGRKLIMPTLYFVKSETPNISAKVSLSRNRKSWEITLTALSASI